jgi:hypothetical protein
MLLILEVVPPLFVCFLNIENNDKSVIYKLIKMIKLSLRQVHNSMLTLVVLIVCMNLVLSVCHAILYVNKDVKAEIEKEREREKGKRN